MDKEDRSLIKVIEELKNRFNLSDRAIEDIFSRSVINDIDYGELIFRQGVKNKFLYFIIEGKAEVTRDGEEIAVVRPGDIIGEMSILGKDKATATVKAITDIRAYKFLKEKFNVVLNKYPSMNRAVVLEAINRKNEQNDIEFS